MIKKTLSMHYGANFTVDFSTSQKSLGPSTKGRKHSSPWLVWVTINVRIHRSLSVSCCPLWMLNSLAWDKRLFTVSMVLMGSIMSHQMQTSLHIRSQQKLLNWIKYHLDFLFKLWIRTKVQAVSSGLLYLQANENWLLAKLFLMFHK